MSVTKKMMSLNDLLEPGIKKLLRDYGVHSYEYCDMTDEIKVKANGKAIRITRQMVEDDQFGRIAAQVKSLATGSTILKTLGLATNDGIDQAIERAVDELNGAP